MPLAFQFGSGGFPGSSGAKQTQLSGAVVLSSLFYDTGLYSVKQRQVRSAARLTVLLFCGFCDMNKRAIKSAILSRHCYRMTSRQTVCV